jgi:hypothetical protein
MLNTTMVAKPSMDAHHMAAAPAERGRGIRSLARRVAITDAATGINAAATRTAMLSAGRVRHRSATCRAGVSIG